MLDMGLGLISATTSPGNLATCCSDSNLETAFDMHNAELNETMGQAPN